MKSSFFLREVRVSPPLVLAPMVGLSHTALRGLIVELGGVGLLYTEMLSARRLPMENENISPLLLRAQNDSPLFYQVFLNDCATITPAVEKLHKLGAHGIDINLGCPAPKLRKQNAGCALSKDHRTVGRIIACFRRNTELPITVKIRLGDAHDQNRFLRLCRLIENEGADGLTIHARLNSDKFCRKPRWDWIGLAKQEVSIPVIANGGIFTAEDARKCLEISRADGLMLGRGAAHKPWLFAQICRSLFGQENTSDIQYVHEVYQRFICLLKERFPPERRLGRLKQFTHYFAGTYAFGHRLAASVQTSSSLAQAELRAANFFAGNEILTI